MRHPEILSSQKIMIRSTNWIGDAVMTTPALHWVRLQFPASEISVVANPVVAELFSHHPDCDRVIILDKGRQHRGISGFLQFCKELRTEKFELAILFQNAIEAAAMAWLARIPLRAGYRTDCRGPLLTHPVGIGSLERSLHHTNYYTGMIGKLGIRTGEIALSLALTEDEKRWAGSVLGKHGWAVLNPGAAYGSAKRWLPDRFAAVGDEIAARYGLSVLLVGSRGEVGIGEDIQAMMKTRPVNMVGRTSVRQLMALIEGAEIMITNDSGPMHVAAAFDIPTVALFGSTDHTTTSPLSKHFEIVRKPVQCAPCMKRVCPIDHRCMNEITAQDVLAAIERLIACGACISNMD